MTDAHVLRISEEFLKIVKDAASDTDSVELINDTVYYFGSELATLHLLKAYRNSDKARVSYSVNLSSHFFALDVNA